MTIETYDEYWKGSNFNDLKKYIISFSDENYKADEVIQSKCTCGNHVYQVQHEPDEGFVKLTCSLCKQDKYIADCYELENDIEPEYLTCSCSNNIFEIGVGFAYRKKLFFKSDIKWITVGARCAKCGIMGVPADWKIDYSPSLFLRDKI